MKLKASNGRILKVGSVVKYGEDKCYIYQIDYENIGLERLSGSASWDMIEASQINCKWVK